jgi:rod shape-determining protein MreD
MNWLNSIFILAIAFVAVFLEASFSLFRNFVGAQISILPALMVYTSLTNGLVTIALLAVCGGLWLDSLSLNPLGVSILPLFVIGFLIFAFRDLLLRENRFAQAMLGLAASAIAPAATLFLLLNIGTTPILGWKTIWQWLVMTLCGGMLTPVCFTLFDRLHQAFNYQPTVQPGFRSDRERKRGRALS